MKPRDKRSARLLESAMQSHQSGRLGSARAQYEEVLSRRPDDPDALHFYGVLQHNEGRSAEGLASIRRSLKVAPDNPHAWLNLGNMLLELERCEEAKAAYERSSALEPKLADAWYNLGICLRKMEDPSGAVQALERALDLRPGHAPSAYQRGVARRDTGDLTAAEADFRRALELNPGYVEVYESLGMLLYRQDRILDAAKVYQAWAQRDPSSSTAAHMAAATSGQEVPERGSDAYITDTFDRFAATFDQNLANLGYQAPRLVAAALGKALPPGTMLECVLDAGCGTGLCAPLLRAGARRLWGVDLSSKMVEAARGKGQYDELFVDELCRFMRGYRAEFDAIVCADTFVYFGALQEAFAAAAQCLKPSGLLVMTLEELPVEVGQDYRLEPHGRYSHRLGYLREVLKSSGFSLLGAETQVLRRERGEDVRGLVLSAVRSQVCTVDGS
jgi:predicted TPR repeat methyltransferase